MDDESITHFARLLKQRDEAAARKIWDAYFHRMIGVARKRLGLVKTTAFDAEDVALSALNCFMEGVQESKFPDLNDRSNLWRILVAITAGKANDRVKHERRLRRGGGNVRNESVFERLGPDDPYRGIADALSDQQLAPAAAAEMQERMNELLDQLGEDERQVALDKLEGFTNQEIAQRCGCAVATIERRLKRIRRKWLEGAC